MKAIRVVCWILCVAVINSCSQKNAGAKKAEDTDEQKAEKVAAEPTWADSMIGSYLASNSGSRLRIGLADSINISSITDSENLDGKSYLRVRLGINNAIRFETLQLLFLNVESKQIYEYEPLQDSLVLWQPAVGK